MRAYAVEHQYRHWVWLSSQQLTKYQALRARWLVFSMTQPSKPLKTTQNPRPKSSFFFSAKLADAQATLTLENECISFDFAEQEKAELFILCLNILNLFIDGLRKKSDWGGQLVHMPWSSIGSLEEPMTFESQHGLSKRRTRITQKKPCE